MTGPPHFVGWDGDALAGPPAAPVSPTVCFVGAGVLMASWGFTRFREAT